MKEKKSHCECVCCRIHIKFVFISFFLASPPIYMVWVCLYKVFFCQSQHWRLRLGKYGSTDKTHESHTLTHSWSTRLRWNFHWNTEQWQPNTHEHTPMHTDRWESMFAFLFCLLFFSNVIIELPQNYVLHKFSERSRYRRLVYYYITIVDHFSSLAVVPYLWCVCLYHDHLSIRFYFSICGRVSNIGIFFAASHCISCSAFATHARTHTKIIIIIACFHILFQAHPKLLNYTHSASLSLV